MSQDNNPEQHCLNQTPCAAYGTPPHAETTPSCLSPDSRVHVLVVLVQSRDSHRSCQMQWLPSMRKNSDKELTECLISDLVSWIKVHTGFLRTKSCGLSSILAWSILLSQTISGAYDITRVVPRSCWPRTLDAISELCSTGQGSRRHNDPDFFCQHVYCLVFIFIYHHVRVPIEQFTIKRKTRMVY
ncbi:hypothetical protein PILCRDRAFT_160431 [Piloderma croceum F 1598]|uniref:Uncharacterized protein n=1 Tax=Piloderma croceum (strain F 1598) TaxID=765440 RepID=A0A0C3BWU4_PILCF|nr:hypothetical protein PILCRDRAFT_160431 [Piloderma croceum F 1598]